jgi:hypothetical protein
MFVDTTVEGVLDECSLPGVEYFCDADDVFHVGDRWDVVVLYVQGEFRKT